MKILQQIKDWLAIRKIKKCILSMDKCISEVLNAISSSTDYYDALTAIEFLEKEMGEKYKGDTEKTEEFALMIRNRYSAVIKKIKKEIEWKLSQNIVIQDNRAILKTNNEIKGEVQR